MYTEIDIYKKCTIVYFIINRKLYGKANTLSSC